MNELNILNEKISAVLFLYNDSISVSKIKELLEIQDIKEEELLEIFENLDIKLNEIGLGLLKKDNKNFEKIELTIVIKKEMSEIAKKIKKDELEGELTPASSTLR